MRHVPRVSAIIAVLGVVDVASAATYHVVSGGTDAPGCAAATPCGSIKYAASLAGPGDTVLVQAGTYAETFSDEVPGGTSWALPVTIAAAPGETVIIQPPAGSDRVFTFGADSSRYIVLDGLILDGINTTYDTVKINYGGGGHAHHIRLVRCEVMNAPRQGILVTDDDPAGMLVTGNEFIDLVVHDNGATDFDHGFYISTSENLVEGCEVYRNAGWGVHVYNGTNPGASRNVVRNNRVYDNARAGNRGVGIGIYEGTGTVAYNNLVWGNQIGINLDYTVQDAGAFNNVVFANANEGIVVGSGATGSLIQNNIVYQNGSGITDAGSGTVSGTNLVDTDPQFVDGPGHDFPLLATSPAIDQGTTVATVAADFDGVARPQGTEYDIGAFEHAAGGQGGAGGTGGTLATGGAAGTLATGGAPALGGSAGSSGEAGSPSSDDDGGCGCSVPAASHEGSMLWMALASSLLVSLRRRRAG
jgi:parallel beta-helix repeat protein